MKTRQKGKTGDERGKGMVVFKEANDGGAEGERRGLQGDRQEGRKMDIP